MAETGKKSKGGGASKKASDGAGAKAEKAAHEPAEASEGAGHGHAAHAHAGGAHAVAHGHAPNRKEYMIIFVVLFVLTVLEVAVAQIPGISKTLLGIALVSMALTKAACVAFFYMHLKHETKILRWSVVVPFSAPVIYALVLIAEGAWRLTR